MEAGRKWYPLTTRKRILGSVQNAPTSVGLRQQIQGGRNEQVQKGNHARTTRSIRTKY
uniref:Uncharacterized protein n=1 Tax=uncultured marine virus TaxID=186617 RepID=A0A0F7L7G9_9VIRU|nr:hypothetical protein [uncultured marine virus]